MHKVKLNDKEIILDTKNKSNLLLAMDSKGLNVKVGCLMGVCEVCKLKVVKGKENIVEEVNHIFDLKDDEILPCCCSIKGDVNLKSI